MKAVLQKKNLLMFSKIGVIIKKRNYLPFGKLVIPKKTTLTFSKTSKY